ncbi:MAG: hypothetical protein LBG67_03265 [Campylobacteraceae bacterium]|jgi:hypothetical protein|nr:hypothetical protein [Campylobacteraceae bacterium]
MRSFIVSAVMLFALVIMTGCRGYTKSSYVQTPDANVVNVANGFTVGQVEDLSSFQFRPGDSNAFSLKDTMETTLESELSKQGLIGESYQVDVNILEYSPGDAFIRWLTPLTSAVIAVSVSQAAGATYSTAAEKAGYIHLSVEAMVVGKEGDILAKIPIKRVITASGPLTIGAYKHIFKDVAKEIVAVIKKQK